MGKFMSWYPSMCVDGTGSGVVSHAGAVALLRTADRTGLSRALSSVLAPWRRPTISHDPGKVMLDLAVALAIGGDCLADIAVLRAQPGVFGSVASDPTGSLPWLRMRRRRYAPWLLPARRPGRWRGRSRVSGHPITVSMPNIH